MQQQRSRRGRVDRGIYRRIGADGRARYEIGYRDSDGRQRWQTVEGGIKAARLALADVKARMGKGERVSPTPNLTFEQAAQRWLEAQGGASSGDPGDLQLQPAHASAPAVGSPPVRRD